MKLFLVVILCFLSGSTLFGWETADCYIELVSEQCDRKYIIKQIKDCDPSEQALLVVDATACGIARAVGIPMNHVELVPYGAVCEGKKLVDLPATKHSFVVGADCEQSHKYCDLDIHQRRRAKTSEQKGLTANVVQQMARHKDLPGIVAFDTFVGNADRSCPNVFYDASRDVFCGIDCAASFCTPLAEYARFHVASFVKGHYVPTRKEFAALLQYRDVLQLLYERFTLESVAKLLEQNFYKAGFCDENLVFFNQDVYDRAAFHKKMFRENYEQCGYLLHELSSYLAWCGNLLGRKVKKDSLQ